MTTMEDVSETTSAREAAEQYQEAHYRLYFAQFSQAVPAVLALLGINIYNLHGTVPAYLLYVWAGLLLLMYFLRSRLKYYYDKAAAEDKATEIDWGRFIVMGSALTGLLWGMSAFLTLYGVELEALMLMLIVVTILVTGNTVTHAAIKHAARAFSTTSLLPFVLIMFWRGSVLEIQIGIALLLLYVTMMSQGNALAGMVSRNILLSDSYFKTIKQLEASQRRSSQLIDSLESQMKETRCVESQLRSAEERYQFAEQQAGFGHWQWDIEANKISFSKEASMLLFKEDMPKELIGDLYSYLSKLVHPEDYGKLFNAIDYSINKEVPLEQKFRFLNQGQETWLQLKADIIHDSEGRKSLRGVIHDINSDMLFRMRLDQHVSSVHALSMENHALMDQYQHGVIKINSDGEIERLNLVMRNKMQLSEQHALMLVSANIQKILDDNSLEIVQKAASSCVAQNAKLLFYPNLNESQSVELNIQVTPLCQNGIYSGMLLIENQ